MRALLLSGLVASLTALALCTGALAADTAGNDGNSAPLSGVDLSIPTQPAAHVLGVDPSGVQCPSNLRELLVTAINSTDRRGHLQQGFALAITGWRIGTVWGKAAHFRRDRMRLDTEYSVVAVKGTVEDDPSSKLAIGVSVPLIDDRQPLQDDREVDAFLDAIGQARPVGLATLIPDVNALLDPEVEPLPATATLNDVRAALWDLTEEPLPSEHPVKVQLGALWGRFAPLWDAASSEELKRLAEQRWNARALSVAAGMAWVSPTGLTEDFRSDRYGVWVRGANPMGKHGQFLYAASYRDRETVPDPNNEGQFLRQNAWFVGARYLQGSASGGVSLEVSYSIENPEEGDSERVKTYLFGYEQRVAKDQWLQLSVGSEKERSTGDQLLLGFSYNVGLGNKAQIARPK